MQVYGNGVTRNFLQILEGDLHRAARGLAILLLMTGVVALVAWFALQRDVSLGMGGFLVAFLAAFALGVAYARLYTLRRYAASIREHWNRWMRFSVSCVSVRECYAKVHLARPHPNPWILSGALTLLLVTHFVLALLALNESAGMAETFPLFGLDAALLGFFAGKRLVERLWYQRFLRSVNELLRDGSLGIWGVY